MTADHTVLDYSSQPPRLRCLCCGVEEPITLPMPIRQLVVISDSFAKDHRRCKLDRALAGDRACAREILQEAGIVDANGELTEPYRNDN